MRKKKGARRFQWLSWAHAAQMGPLASQGLSRTLQGVRVMQVIGEPPRPVLHRRAAPAGFNSALKHALVEEAAHEFDLEHDAIMVSTPSMPDRHDLEPIIA